MKTVVTAGLSESSKEIVKNQHKHCRELRAQYKSLLEKQKQNLQQDLIKDPTLFERILPCQYMAKQAHITGQLQVISDIILMLED